MLYKNKFCPYCRYRFSLLSLLYLKDKSSFKCFNCQKNLYVVLNKGVKTLFAVFAIFSILIMLFFNFIFKRLLFGALALTFLFAIFYIMVPRFIYINGKTKEE